MSLNSPDVPFLTERCCDLEDYLSKSRRLLDPGHAWVFRGQRKSSRHWLLKTSFERACERFKVEVGKRTELERQMIREFQRRLHHYLNDVPDITLNDEWLALMQHYGAATRFLDFTYSPYVAAYFAFENAETNADTAVWAIDSTWCTEKLTQSNPDLAARYSSYGEKRDQEDFNAIFMNIQPQKLVLSVNPFRLNERLAFQKGIFLCPGDVTTGFMENLLSFAGTAGLKQSVIQYIIPTGKNGEIRNRALIELERMNINRITLFPGLDGFAQSLSVKIITQFLPLQSSK